MADDLVYCDESLNVPAIPIGKDSTSILGKWQNVGYHFDLKLSLPEFIQNIIDQINSLIETIKAILDIALTGLRIAKTFLQGLLDPIREILDLLLSTIRAIIEDIKSVGFYLTGDWWLLDPTMSHFRGGYRQYEKRMVARFTDKTDPTLPKIPPSKDVFGVFFYIGVDFSGIDKIRRLLVKILQLFRFDLSSVMSVSSMPVPINPGVRYKTDFSWGPLTEALEESVYTQNSSLPEVAEVFWNLNTAATEEAYIQFFPPPPGFFVYVSTTRDGISVQYDKPFSNTISEEKESTKAKRKTGQTLNSSGKSFLKIYGGAQELNVQSKHQLAGVFGPKGEFKDGVSVVYGMRDKNEPLPIPIEQLVNTNEDGEQIFIFQRMFYISTASIFGVETQDLLSGSIASTPAFFQKAEYTFTVNKSELPYEAEFSFVDNEVVLNKETLTRPGTVYVRVSSTNLDLDPDNFSAPYAISGDVTRAYPVFDALYDAEILVSDPTEPVQIVFPSGTSLDFLHLIETALYVLILSRADVEVVPTSQMGGRSWFFEEGKAAFQTGLEDQGFLVQKILGGSPAEYFSKEELGNTDKNAFRENLRDKVRNWANILYEQFAPEPDLETSLVDITKEDLLDWTFQDVVPLIQSSISSKDPGDELTIDIDQESSVASIYMPVKFTIRGAFEESDSTVGVFRNPFCAGIQVSTVDDRSQKIRMREPGFFVRGSKRETGSVDNSPVLLLSQKNQDASHQRVVFLRNIFPRKVYNAAAIILRASTSIEDRAPEEGGWLSLRLGDYLPGFEEALAGFSFFIETLLEGIGSIIDSIVAYIEFVEARIRDLQDFLDRIDFVTSLIIPFDLPKAGILFVKGRGLQGVLNEFLVAEDKPLLSDVVGKAVTTDAVAEAAAAEAAAATEAAGAAAGAAGAEAAAEEAVAKAAAAEAAGTAGTAAGTAAAEAVAEAAEAAEMAETAQEVSFAEYQQFLTESSLAIGGEPIGTYGGGAVLLAVGSSIFNDILYELLASALS